MEHMEVRVDSNKIAKILKLRGEERLEVVDDVTAGIHATIEKMVGNSCVQLAFLKTVQKDSWVEYSLLLEFPKAEEHIKYLGYEFKELGKFLETLEKTIDYDSAKIDSIGIDGVETGLPGSYYILLYMLRDGKQ